MRLVPKNWESFQHYKDRCPPWIKLHKGLLDDSSFQRLPTASRALAPMLWLIASESKDGSFDGSVEELSFRLRQTEEEIREGIEPLISKGFFVVAHVASTSLAGCTQVAVPETETETETETESFVAKADPMPNIPVQTVVEIYHEVLPELPRVKILDDERKKAIGSFCKWVLTSKRSDGQRRATTPDEAIDWIRAYLDRARSNDFLMGRGAKAPGHENWQCDIDFLMSDKGKKQVIEKTRETA